MADGRRYDGRHLTEILRAIRNIAEHWFHPQTAQEEAALEVCSLHIFDPVLALARYIFTHSLLACVVRC